MNNLVIEVRFVNANVEKTKFLKEKYGSSVIDKNVNNNLLNNLNLLKSNNLFDIISPTLKNTFELSNNNIKIFLYEGDNEYFLKANSRDLAFFITTIQVDTQNALCHNVASCRPK